MSRELPVARFSDDAEIVAALRGGDEDAFRHIVRLHDASLRRLGRLYVGDAFAEEVVQETWVTVAGGIERFAGRSTLKTWIFGILVNKARRRGERERRTIPFASAGSGTDRYDGAVPAERLHHPQLGQGYWPVAPTWPRDPESSALASEVRAVVRDALRQLTPAQREVMTLRDLEGWPAQEVCEVLGISDANQRSLLHRARVAVRRALEVYFDG